MGKQSRLRKLRKQCKDIVNTNNATKLLDDFHKDALIKEVYRKGKNSVLNASTNTHSHTPKQGQSE
jgi:hypothetical protein